MVADSELDILIIDDEADVLDLMADVLQSNGHRVETANSAGQAFGLLERCHFDVILSDIRMPKMSGPEFLRQLTSFQHEKAHRVGFVTGETLGTKTEDLLSGSDTPLLEKPFTPEELRHFVIRLAAGDGQ